MNNDQLANMLLGVKSDRKFAKAILINGISNFDTKDLEQIREAIDEKLNWGDRYKFGRSKGLIESLIRQKKK